MMLTLAAALILGGVANAQSPITIEPALAAAIHDALPDLDSPRSLDWDVFIGSGDPNIRWHDPGRMRTPSPPGEIRRRGWMSVNGRTAEVSVCGDRTRVGAMMLKTSDIWLEDGDLTPDLEALGVTMVEIARRDRPDPLPWDDEADVHTGYVRRVTALPAYRLLRLERSGFEPAFLTASYICTPPGTRSATQCTMHWTLELRAGDTPRADTCLAPADRVMRSQY